MILPPILVPHSEELDLIGRHLDTMFYMGAGITTLLFILALVGTHQKALVC
jgi:hypothetical protein